MQKTAISKDVLISIAAMVKPALSTTDYIPALSHIMFQDGYATAYNDIAAISVHADVNINACVPGELFARTLNSFASDTVHIEKSDSGALAITSGRSKVKLPSLECSKYPLKWPKFNNADGVLLSPSIMLGIERCLVGVGTDPTHPAQMGVTLDVFDDGCAALYSTDNFTLSRYVTNTEIKLSAGAVILPTFFCQQLVSLHKAFADTTVCLYVLPGAVCAKLGNKANLFSRTMVDLAPLDFAAIVGKHCNAQQLKGHLLAIPDAWDASFARALLVQSGQVDKSTTVQVSEGYVHLISSSPQGDAEDKMRLKTQACTEFFVDPTLVVRASKLCGFVSFSQKGVVAMADSDKASFLHLISHCSK